MQNFGILQQNKLCHLGAQDLDADAAELSQESRIECRTRSTQDNLANVCNALLIRSRSSRVQC